jgi:hypothetical protein
MSRRNTSDFPDPGGPWSNRWTSLCGAEVMCCCRSRPARPSNRLLPFMIDHTPEASKTSRELDEKHLLGILVHAETLVLHRVALTAFTGSKDRINHHIDHNFSPLFTVFFEELS